MEKATQQQTKEHNRNLVFKTILEQISISRADIARATHLTRTTVSDIVSELMQGGLVDEIGIGSSRGGKAPILLSVVENSRTLIGLDLAQNQFSGAVINLCGKLSESISLPVNERDGDEALDLVYEILDLLVEAAGTSLVGIGIGTPGLVNTRDGIVVQAVNLDWSDLPLADLLRERYRLPVCVLNDSQAAAMGEYTYGAEFAERKNLIVINARHGIGAGIVIDGQLFQGDGGGAGEIGHVVVVRENGLLCRCGNYGCLETVASAQAILKRVRHLVSQSANTLLPQQAQEITWDTVKAAYTAGDGLVHQVVLEAASYIGLAISGLVGMLNIHNIVLSGELTCFGAPWLEAIHETMMKTSLSGIAGDTRVEIGKLDPNAIIMGAAALLSSNYSLLFNP
jgi:N-acetylglucosamine repressor